MPRTTREAPLFSSFRGGGGEKHLFMKVKYKEGDEWSLKSVVSLCLAKVKAWANWFTQTALCPVFPVSSLSFSCCIFYNVFFFSRRRNRSLHFSRRCRRLPVQANHQSEPAFPPLLTSADSDRTFYFRATSLHRSGSSHEPAGACALIPPRLS